MGRGGRVVRDTEKRSCGNVSSRALQTEVLPDPEGPVTAMNIPSMGKRSLDILGLLPQLGQFALEFDDVLPDGNVVALRPDGVHLPAHLLEQEVELAPDGLRALEELLHLGDVALESHDLLG